MDAMKFLFELKENMKAGIKNIAYIRTNYQKRPLTEVLADVDKYYELYGKDNKMDQNEAFSSTKESVVKYGNTPAVRNNNPGNIMDTTF